MGSMVEAGAQDMAAAAEPACKKPAESPLGPLSPNPSEDGTSEQGSLEVPNDHGLTNDILKEEAELEKQRLQEEQASAKVEQSGQVFRGQAELENLLQKTQLFSQFIEAKVTAEVDKFGGDDEGEPSGSTGGKKRKITGKAGGGRKKAKGRAAEQGAIDGKKEAMEGGRREGETEEDQMMREQKELMPLFKGQLRAYQVKGVKWMISLWKNGLNGILADQMGLGKTVQVIALLSHFKHNGIGGPFLIVAPLSTLSNWVSEFERWCPALPATLYHGSRETREQLRNTKLRPDTDIGAVITSFEIAMNDQKFLRHHKWKHMIIDEGHRLKNFDCKLLRELKQYPADNILLLTGTPLQNKLSELWSLLNFILPKVFTDLKSFDSWFNLDNFKGGDTTGNLKAMQEKQRTEVVSKLHAILRPFLLRRLKEDVEASLPRKKEIILYAQMAPKQAELNKHLVEKTINQHFAASGNRAAINNMLMQLRKNSNHPDLLESQFEESLDYPPVDQLLADCGKLKLLDRLLTHLKRLNHKVLIFSQMTRMLDLLDYYLEQRGIRACRIDGSVSQEDRQAQIKDYNTNPDVFVFLLSTRAGGLGINLTSADSVIIYDSDWNPQQDLQAMDRCHRIGQTKPVHVYRLATAHSVECKMLEAANSKLKLEHMVITKGNFRFDKDKAEEAQEELRSFFEPQMDAKEELAQSADISEEDLVKLLDRSDLERDGSGVDRRKSREAPGVPLAGPGWAVVVGSSSGGAILSAVE